MLIFAKFRLKKIRHFRHCRILCSLCYSYRSFFKGILVDSCILYLCFAIHTGVFLNDVKQTKVEFKRFPYQLSSDLPGFHWKLLPQQMLVDFKTRTNSRIVETEKT